MVLSNKKLKQKLRAQLAESLANSESQLTQPDPSHSQTHQSFKSLLNSATQKPILSKREIRRVKTPVLEKSSKLEDGDGKKESEKGNRDGLSENKKRKREKDGVEVKDLSEKKNKNKKKNNKKKKVEKKEEVVVVKENGVSEEQGVVEAIQTQTSKEDESIATKIYVGGIPYYSTVDDIRSFFEGCGSITEIDCLKFPETGKFNGIAMISFRTDAAAKRALTLDGSDMGGLSLKVQPYKATRDKKVSDFAPAMLDGYNRIYVGNLSWDMNEDELKKFFSDCSISAVRLGKDKQTGEFRGFAHVDFSDNLSLTMALKLDQKPLFGRPVRVRCAVPPKVVNPGSSSDVTGVKNEGNVKSVSAGASGDTIVNDEMARKAKRQTCYDCGEKGHLSSSCPNKKAADVAVTDYETNYTAFDGEETDNVGDGKLKRRTCYECGEKGHLSSLCPNKKAADVAHTYNRTNDVLFDEVKEEVGNLGDGKLKRRSCYECGEKGHLSSSCPKKQAADVANSVRETFAPAAVVYDKGVDYNTVNSVSDGKLRRRTCYECGEKGHLSSACPKVQAADVANLVKEINHVAVEKADVAVAGKEGGDNMMGSVSEGKLRRRTCYECGERGHLSSLCPKKEVADVANSVKKVNDTAVEKADVAVAGNEGGDTVVGLISDGKLKRRTCYECGERGHLSSLCPTKQAADVASLNKEGDDMEVEKVEVTTTPAVSGGKIKRRNCYECGLKGHLSSMCPNKKDIGLTT
ncbi:phragmoplastin interacting protein 1 [Rutidosis leptorrhynchoides]|uniref:phragmoplastin interacting protein 1 n=1 Tax=Rutidosis leptorrhynchoides TaxID=125765 RepID=UPI003A9A2CB3